MGEATPSPNIAFIIVLNGVPILSSPYSTSLTSSSIELLTTTSTELLLSDSELNLLILNGSDYNTVSLGRGGNMFNNPLSS